MHANGTELTGYAAAICTTVAYVPQLQHVLRVRSARDISPGMFLIISLGSTLWLVYGLRLHSIPVIACNGMTFLLSVSILMLKLRYDRNAVNEIKPGKENL